LLDGTQSIGIEPFDVQQIQPDLVTCSVHKWLLSPYGTSLLYLHPRHHDTWQPLDQHDRSRLGKNEPEWVEVSGMHSSLNPVYPLAFQWGARCISSGGRPNPILLPMISSALDLILETFCGPESLLSHVSNLTDLFLRCLETDSSEPSHQSAIPEEVRQSPTEARYSPIGILILPRKLLSQHILGLRLHPSVSLSPSEICHRLEEMGIKISVRQSYLRISPYLYNTPQQMIRLYTQLRQIIVTGGRKTLESPLTLLPFVHSPKILIIGGSGWLGQYVFKRLQHQCPLLLSRQHEIHVTYCSNPPHFLPSHCRHRIDLSSSCPSSEIDDLLATLKPEIILHLAAQSSLMKCDRDPQAAALSNCPLPLIEAVKRHVPNALFVYTSTDIVYDGICPPFHPLSPSSLSTSSCPSTTYGKTKLLFEYEVLSLPKGLVLRLSNMIGGGYVYESPSQNAGMKFLQWLQKNYLLKNSISLKNDEKRSFVSVHDVTMLIQRIVELSLGDDSESHECWSQRIYNVGGPIGLSRLELAEILCRVQNCELLIEGKDNGRDKEKDKHKVTEESHSKSSWRVSSVSSESLKSSNPLDTVAPRDVTMDISLTESHFGIQFHDLSEVLASILADF
jgi:nucleoside-diphosphate-sugar epimerase